MCNGYELLIEKEEMWARMLMEVLGDNGIPCAAKSVHGAGLVIRAGMQERLKVYVPKEYFEQASELVKVLFSDESAE
jgi:hypothetical protein